MRMPEIFTRYFVREQAPQPQPAAVSG